jgi:type IV pilus assembly protein PilA
MLAWFRSRLNKDEGFTLVELMVVVLIIAILIAIAIPTFLGARRGAQDRAAQAQVRNALVAEKAFFVDNGAYTAVAADITALEPNLVVDPNPAVGVALSLGAAGEVCITRISDSTNVFSIFEDPAAGTQYSNQDLSAACAVPGDARATGW